MLPLVTASSSSSRFPSMPTSLLLEPDVLESWASVQRDRIDRVLSHPRPHPYEAPQIIHRGKHDTLDGELLNVVQDRFPLSAVALTPLLLEERIDLRIAPIRIGPQRRDMI